MVGNDLEGAVAVMDWLSYVPPRRGAPLPVLRAPGGRRLVDPVARKAE